MHRARNARGVISSFLLHFLGEKEGAYGLSGLLSLKVCFSPFIRAACIIYFISSFVYCFQTRTFVQGPDMPHGAMAGFW